MKVSTAALSFLILAAALGSQAGVIHDLEKSELLRIPKQPSIQNSLAHGAADCCFSYTPRTIRCIFMKNYYVTSSGCSQSGVIFLSKRGRQICANPSDDSVVDCMANLSLTHSSGDLIQ